MPRKTKYRIRRQKKNKTKRRINKLIRGKTYKKLYNNRRFTGGIGMRQAARAAATAAAAAGLAYFYRGAPVSEVIVSDAPVYDAPVYKSPISDALPPPIPRSPPSPRFPQKPTLSPRPIYSSSPAPPPLTSASPRSSLSLYPPAPPPPPRPPCAFPSTPPWPMPPSLSLLYSSPLQYSSLLKKAQINKDKAGAEKVTDIIAPDYSLINSTHLLGEPPRWVVEKAKTNLAPDRSDELLILPRILPNIDGVDWTVIMSKLRTFYEYLGQTLGPYEVHLIMTPPDPKESDRIVREAHDKITKDTIDGNYIPIIETLKKCGTAICHIYEAKNGKKRYFVNIDIAYFYKYYFQTAYFNNLSNEDKEQYILYHLEYYMAHEYYHVFQQQHISPLLFSRGFGAEDIWARWGNNTEVASGEEQPHAISRWWIESFATIMPYFLGKSEPDDKGMKERVKNAIKIIISNKTLTQEEFSDRMMYKYRDHGYLMADPDRQDWAFLAAACMAQRKSWNYLLGGHFYKDFQRIKSDTPIKKNGETVYVPDADNIWLHNFGMTQKDFLHSIFDLVRSGEITVDSLRDVLPGGANWSI